MSGATTRQPCANGVHWPSRVTPTRKSALAICTSLAQAYRKTIHRPRNGIAEQLNRATPTAQFSLGYMYTYGEGVLEDHVEAVKWLRKAAEQSHVEAQFSLGVMYSTGRGVSKDDAEAVRWFHKAAEQNYAPAQESLGVSYAMGTGVSRDDVEAVKWFRRAAEQGNATAQFYIGLMYGNGRGVPEDNLQAYAWLNIAAAQGDATAEENKEVLAESMSRAEIAAAQIWHGITGKSTCCRFETDLHRRSDVYITQGYAKLLTPFRDSFPEGLFAPEGDIMPYRKFTGVGTGGAAARVV